MESYRRDLTHIRHAVERGAKLGVRCEVTRDGAMIVKHQVRIVPAAAQVELRPGVPAIEDVIGRPVEHVEAGTLAVEITAAGLGKIATEVEVEPFAARSANQCPALYVTELAKFAVIRPEPDIDRVVAAGGVGVQTSPALPVGKEVEASAHVERPGREQGSYASHDGPNQQEEEHEPRQAAKAGFSLHWERGHLGSKFISDGAWL